MITHLLCVCLFLYLNDRKSVVWNIKSQSARLVLLTPSNDWGGAGLLGVTIRLDDYAGAEDRLVRILTVEEGSPAEIAGLQSETDFLLGTTHQTLDSVDRLASAVLQPNVNRVVELYVYNTETDMVRVVALMPTNNWKKGRGLLGAEVGTGYLHRLPSKTRETEGSSLERKVRYVDVKVDNSDGAATAHPSSSPLQQRRLELEPQLEMEPPSSDDDVDLPHTPLKEAASMPENNLCRQDEKKVATEPIPDTKAPARAPSSYGLQPHEVQAIFQKPPPVQDIAVTSAAPSLQHNFSGGYHSNDNLHYQQSSPSHLYGGPAPPHIVPQPQQPTNQIAVPVQHSPYSALPSHKSSQHTFPSPVYGSGYGNAPIPTYQPKTSPPPPQQPQPPPYAGTTSNHQQSFPNRMNPFSMTAPPRSFSNNIQYGGGGGVADAASPPNTTNNNNNNNNSSNAGN